MEIRDLKLFCLALCAAAFASSCDDDDNTDPYRGSIDNLPQRRAFVLNQGSDGMNNAGLALYAPEADSMFCANIFRAQNGRELGDNGQDLITDGRHIYVSVSSSKYVAKLSLSGVEICRYAFGDKVGVPRSLVIDGNDLYVSVYGGYIFKLDAQTLTKKDSLATSGNNLEEMALCNGRLYAANSWTMDGTAYVYNTDLVVVDTKTFTQVASVEVAQNPNYLKVSDGKLFCLSFGNYYDKGYTLQMLDPESGAEPTVIGTATQFAVGGGRVLTANSVTDWSTYATTTTLAAYDPATGTTDDAFFADVPEALAKASVYMMAVDPEAGDIYVATTDYYTDGTVYRFDADGRFAGSFGSCGLNPYKMIFVE